jgi:hypothetical protein
MGHYDGVGKAAFEETVAELRAYGPINEESWAPRYTLSAIQESIEFKAYPKTPRLRRTVIITEKIDGTNAAVGITEQGTVYAQSRNRVITPGKTTDNCGFATWVEDNQDFLRDTLRVGLHFGEWWGQGIQRGYGQQRKFFSLFNTMRWSGLAYHTGAHDIGLGLVPVLNIGELTDDLIDRSLYTLRTFGSTAAPGFMDPEGIIVFHTASGQVYKVTLDGDGHKGQS